MPITSEKRNNETIKYLVALLLSTRNSAMALRIQIKNDGIEKRDEHKMPLAYPSKVEKKI
jgi:hypothetical protein